MQRVSLCSGSLGSRICLPCSSRFYSAKAAKDESSGPSVHAVRSIDSLGYDEWAEVDAETKTIDTVAGELPISPLLDPKWRTARRRAIPKQAPDKTRYNAFQRKVDDNPFAQMLAQSVRSCHVTRARLPKSFLQDFGLVREPVGGHQWWIPSNYRPPPQADAAETSDAVEAETSINESQMADSNSGLDGGSQDTVAASSNKPAKFFAPAHALMRQDLLLEFFNKRGKYPSGWMRFAANPSVAKIIRGATWRQDMDQVILAQMHRDIISQLSYLARMTEESNRHYLKKGDFETLRLSEESRRTNCIISLDDDWDPYEMVLTGTGYSLPVFNLPLLLGSENIERLRDEQPFLRDATALLLRGKRTTEATRLLWQLQGYIHDYCNE